jgi:hypothetical protein
MPGPCEKEGEVRKMVKKQEVNSMRGADLMIGILHIAYLNLL